MKIITHRLSPTHNLFLVSDIHEGNILQHEHGLQQMVEMVLKDKSNYVAVLGDLAEGITIDDKRYDRNVVSEKTPLPLLQYQWLVEVFKPIKDRILVVLEGNHDFKISARFGNGVRDIFCKHLDAPYGTFSAKLIIQDKKGILQYKAFLTHGAKMINSTADDPVRREANMQLSLKRLLYRKAGDCAILARGHSHKLIIKEPITELYLTDNGDRIQQNYTKSPQTAKYIHPDLRWYVNTGSFYKLYSMGESGYAERFDCDPIELGFCIARVEDGQIKKVEKVILE